MLLLKQVKLSRLLKPLMVHNCRSYSLLKIKQINTHHIFQDPGKFYILIIVGPIISLMKIILFIPSHNFKFKNRGKERPKTFWNSHTFIMRMRIPRARKFQIDIHIIFWNFTLGFLVVSHSQDKRAGISKIVSSPFCTYRVETSP